MTLPLALSYDSEFMIETNIRNVRRAKFKFEGLITKYLFTYFNVDTLLPLLPVLVGMFLPCFSVGTDRTLGV